MLLPPIGSAAARAELAALVPGLFSQEKRLLPLDTAVLPCNTLAVERLRGAEGVTLARDLRKLGLDPARVDLQALTRHEAGRLA